MATFLVFLLVGCATIVNDNFVDVPIETNPQGATITYGGKTFTTPCTLEIPRGEERSIEITIEKPGYKPVNVRLERSLDGWLWGNILTGGLIGLAVDFISGDAYDLSPEQVGKILKSEGEPGEAEDMKPKKEEIPEETDQYYGMNNMKLVIIDIDTLDSKTQQQLRN